MNLHEYQAKELLKRYNVPTQEGIAVETVEPSSMMMTSKLSTLLDVL